VATLALLLLPLQPRPVAAEVIALSKCEKLALKDRPALASDAARLRGARAETDRASSAYYPSLSFEAQSSVSPGSVLFSVADPATGSRYLVPGAPDLGSGRAFDPQFRQELALELRGTIYDFGRTAAAVEAGRARQGAGVASADATRARIVGFVRSAYLAWLGASELQNIAAQAAADAENRRTHLEALIAEGVKPHADLSPALSDELLIKLELERARGELRTAKLMLEQAIGKPLSETAEPDLALLQRVATVSTPAPDPALRALASQREAANKTTRQQDKGNAPVLTGKLSAGARAQGTTVFPAYAVGIGFSVPLWDGGVAHANAAVARARVDELSAQMRERRELHRNDLQRARLDAANANARLTSAEALLETCTQRLQEAEESYELAAGSIDQVAQAREMLRRARSEVVLAKLARVDAELRIAPP
jgi:outer membrane protein TolC